MNVFPQNSVPVVETGASRIRLCVLMGSHFSARMGGAQYQMHRIVEFLKETDHYEIFYVARRVNRGYDPEGYTIVELGRPSGIRKWSFLFDARRLEKVFRDIRPDVIYQRGLRAHAALAARYGRRSGAASVLHLAHDYDVDPRRNINTGPLRQLEKAAAEWGLRRADAIVAQTRRQADMLQTHYGRAADRIVPNCHPLPEESVDKSRAPMRVLWVASIKPTKRPDAFIRLARRMRESAVEGVDFIMVGRSDEDAYAQAVLAQADDVPGLRYLGERPMTEVNRLLAGAHCFVNTSVAEGFPNTFVQAWMREVPVLSLDVDVDDLLQTGKWGVLCRTEERLFQETLRCVRDAGRRKRLGEAAGVMARDRFCPERFIEIDGLIRSVYERSTPAHRLA